MGGHFVQGLVDGTGEIVSMDPEGYSLGVKVKATKDLLKYIIPKAYTQQKIVIPLKKVGQKVNLEVDILGKYVERLLSSGFVDSIKNF
ncbi:hypothetical protein K1719_027202 [Acacia pycnantha]|nr:hypothetical protein K1719_027202 [Acacia pycnantha]